MSITAEINQPYKAMTQSICDIMPYIREIAAQNDDVILAELGLPLKKNGNLNCRCPVHNGDNPTGFSYKSSQKIWKCWTHHCHEKYGSDIIGLVRAIRECSLKDAVDFILDLSENVEINGSPEIKQFIRKNAKVDRVTFDQGFFEDKNMDTPYFIHRGFTKDVIGQFQGFSFKNREYLPIVTDDNKILGFVGRLIVDDSSKPKWKLYPELLEKNSTLFGINLTKDSIAAKHEAILVEGPLDAINLYQNGVKNAVAVMGTSISQEQIKLLIKYKVKKIILAFDPDSAGKETADKLAKRLSLYFYVDNITMSLPKDPGELSKLEIENYFGQI